jgi:hypothetical protein
MKKGLILISMTFFIFLLSCANENTSELHEYSVEIEGKEMKLLSIKETADLWEIEPEKLLEQIKKEFNLDKNYTINTILEDIRQEYPFSPANIKQIAEEIKQKNIKNE